MKLEFEQIKSFYYIVKLGSFSRAAEAVFRTQSAVSQQLKRLEEELEVVLLDRVGRGKIKSTPAGELFSDFVNDVMERHQRFQNDLDFMKGIGNAQLRLAAPINMLYYVFPDLIRKYKKMHPNVKLALLDRSPLEGVKLINEGDIDMCIGTKAVTPKNFTIIELQRLDNTIITPVDHPLTKKANFTLKDVVSYPLILSPPHLKYFSRTKFENLLAMEGLKYQIALESSAVNLSLKYVKIGMGILFLSAPNMVKKYVSQNFAVLDMNRFLPADTIVLVMKKGRRIAKHENDFIDMFINLT